MEILHLQTGAIMAHASAGFKCSRGYQNSRTDCISENIFTAGDLETLMHSQGNARIGNDIEEPGKKQFRRPMGNSNANTPPYTTTGNGQWGTDVQSQTRYSPAISNVSYPPNPTITTQDPLLLTPAPDLDTFYRQRDLLTSYISQMEARVEQIKQLNIRMLQEVNQTNATKLKEQLEDLTKDTSRLLGFARDGVKMLHKSRKGDKKLRMGQYNFVLQKLQAVTKSFLQVQNEIKLSKRDQIARQYKIARPNASEEEIQQAIDSGRTDIFNDVMLSSRIADGQRILGAVQDRQRELNKVLESMTQLQEIMLEMNNLINSQQPMIDETETAVDNTISNVEGGVTQLSEANKSAIKARRTKWIIFWILLVVVIIVAIIVAIEVLKNKSN
ncbi:Plasma membrane t-SNARE, secretory vesicle fusion [Entophlyctis sp. JEL0112]|nr:Plasma membrane t-SNARE, secretory vesicle fusion [Entophlyctis sp. JEL0112]